MGASAYSVMAVAEEPTVDIEGEQFQNGSTFQANGTTFTVNVQESQLQTPTTVEQETTFQNNTEVTYRNETYNVSIAPGNDTSSFTLVEAFDVEAVLAEDPDVQNSTFTRDDGTEVVVYNNGTQQPLVEYLDPQRESFAEGDTIQHDNTTKTVDNVTSARARLTWTEASTRTVALEEGGTFTLGEETYVAHFPDNDTVVISADEQQYDTYENNVEYFNERMSGLLYVMIFSGGSVFLLAALAFLPHRG